MKKLKKWLNKPYTYREDLGFQITIGFVIGFIIFVVLYSLTPFGLGALKNNKVLYFGGYGIIAATVILSFFLLTAPAFPKFFSDSTWTIKKEILTISITVLVIAVFSFFYHRKVAIGYVNQDRYSFFNFLGYAVSVAGFVVLIYVYLSELFLNKSKDSIDQKLKIIKISQKINKTVIIHSANKNSSLTFNLDNLIYITSEGNYTNFYLKDDEGSIKEEKLRVQLAAVENALGSHKKIIRCHKSYIINLNYAIDVSGNARGFYLHLENIETLIPVSRKFKKTELLTLIS